MIRKTVIITGAVGGIGSATAKKFAKNGYNIALIYNKTSPKKLEKGERVSLFKAATFPKALEIFLYLIPLYFFALSFGFGFFFKNSLTHYLVTLGASLLGILVLLVLRFTIGKMPENKFIAIKEGEENENCSKR